MDAPGGLNLVQPRGRQKRAKAQQERCAGIGRAVPSKSSRFEGEALVATPGGLFPLPLARERGRG